MFTALVLIMWLTGNPTPEIVGVPFETHEECDRHASEFFQGLKDHDSGVEAALAYCVDIKRPQMQPTGRGA